MYAISAAEVLAIAGFSTSSPIVPFFLQDLGVADPMRLKVLTGLVQALPSLSLVFFSPIWGSMADNYGRKPMVLRAMIGGVVIMVLQGLVTAPWQLVLLRTIQGCITGTVAAATILVASIAPKEEIGYSLGFLQMSIFIGSSLGPLVGGVIADLFGRRVNFFATAVLLLAAAILVGRFVDDNFTPPLNKKPVLKSMLPDFRPLASSTALLSLMGVIAADQIAGSVLGPFLPLFIQKISGSSERVGSIDRPGAGVGRGLQCFGGREHRQNQFPARLQAHPGHLHGGCLHLHDPPGLFPNAPAAADSAGSELLLRWREPSLRERTDCPAHAPGKARRNPRALQLHLPPAATPSARPSAPPSP